MCGTVELQDQADARLQGGEVLVVVARGLPAGPLVLVDRPIGLALVLLALGIPRRRRAIWVERVGLLHPQGGAVRQGGGGLALPRCGRRGVPPRADPLDEHDRDRDSDGRHANQDQCPAEPAPPARGGQTPRALRGGAGAGLAARPTTSSGSVSSSAADLARAVAMSAAVWKR